MNAGEFLEILSVAEKLKSRTRHSYTSDGRHESVAEHSWRIALMAMLLNQWIDSFPQAQKEEFRALLCEMEAQESLEAKLYKALDKMEAVIQHNEADLSTWLPLEYDLQFTYGKKQTEFSPYMKALKAEIDKWTTEKIGKKLTKSIAKKRHM